MPKSRRSKLVVPIFVLVMLMLVLSPRSKAADPTVIIAITPPIHIATGVSQTFYENVTISTAEGINSVDLTINYNTTLLDVVSVYQGTFFPQNSPPTIFTYDDNSANGTIHISAKLVDPQSQTGNDTLASIIFKPTLDPKTLIYSPIIIGNFEVLNFGHQPMSCDTLGSMYFWKFMTSPPSPPSTSRLVDVYTQRGGTGQGTYGGEFGAGSVVILSAVATYNNFPIQHLPVAFQVLDSQNQTVAILVDLTDENGVATVQFRIRSDTTSEGTWIAVASVDISCTIVLDITNFKVFFPSAVGGYTVNTSKTTDPTPVYVTILAALAATITFSKHRPHKKK